MLVSVEVPNTLPLPNRVYSVQKITIVPTVDPEIIVFTQTGATSGTMNFQILRKKGVTVTYNVNKTLNWNATPAEFTTMLNSFDIFKGFNPSVVLEKFDASGNVITTGTPFKFVWTVTVPLFREDDKTSQNFITTASELVSSDPAVTPTLTIEKIQAHSPAISGNYTLSLGTQLLGYLDSSNAVQTGIPFSTSASQLRAWMATAWGCPDIEVTLGQGSTNNDGNNYIVSFVSCSGAQPIMASSTTFLQGGRLGTVPAVTVTELRAGSNKLLVEPVTV